MVCVSETNPLSRALQRLLAALFIAKRHICLRHEPSEPGIVTEHYHRKGHYVVFASLRYQPPEQGAATERDVRPRGRIERQKSQEPTL